MIHRPPFQPHLKYTRWATMPLPAWAVPVNDYDNLCECERLPVIAKYKAIIRSGYANRTIKQLACPACLHLAMAEQGEYDRMQANAEFDALQPPERANELYRLADVFGDHSRHRLKYWIDAGLNIASDGRQASQDAARSVLYEDLLRFTQNADTWHLWASGRVLDIELRTWIEALQAAWPWRWMNAADTGNYLGYARSREHASILEGVIGARSKGGGRGYFFRSDRVAWFKAEVMPTLHTGGPSFSVLYGEPFLHVETGIPQSYRNEIATIGGGNFSKGVRRLLEWHREEGEREKSGQGRRESA